MERMDKYSRYQPAMAAAGIYCMIQAHQAPLPLGTQNPVPKILASARLFAVASAGVTGGAVQPVRQAADGNYYPLAAPSTITGPGLVFNFETNAPVNAVGIQITQAVVGGTLFLQSDAIAV